MILHENGAWHKQGSILNCFLFQLIYFPYFYEQLRPCVWHGLNQLVDCGMAVEFII
jgi:hypothetical protein